MKRYPLLDTGTIQRFQKIVYRHYASSGRLLPWRETRDPYKILISEVMLQQTQVARVIEKYKEFTAIFPTIEILAQARVSKIMKVWQGLGYNRRVLLLKKMAKTVNSKYQGRIPHQRDVLKTLPGIGEATASAVCAFAFNTATVLLETNIRSVFIHHFFPGRRKVHDREIFPLITQTLDKRNPRRWYSALMDYGVALKEKYPNPSRRSHHYRKQSRFQGSNREIRGKILKILVNKNKISGAWLLKSIGTDTQRTKRILRDLEREGLIKRKSSFISL